jgi:hypothetical protein
LAEVLLSFDPVFRLPVSMRNRQDPDGPANLQIGDVVSESPEIDATITTKSQARYSRISGNPLDVKVNLIAKSAAESRLLPFVVCDGIIEFIRSLR